MKNTITKIFATLLCLALCFAFVGCSEFSGNFSTKATSEEINSTFAKIADAEIATEGITGFQMDMQMKIFFHHILLFLLYKLPVLVFHLFR